MHVLAWLSERRSLKPMSVTEISVGECEPWRLDGPLLDRPDGRFFSGVLSSSQAWILQPEVGVLGFIVSGEAENREILLNLKEEPGNVGMTQIAPTVQATKSNWERVHEGPPQPYIDLFQGLDVNRGPFQQVLNSEQGTRFWRKCNANLMISTSRSLHETMNHRWFCMRDFRLALGNSFAVNTDARSVLASTDWLLLLGNDFSGIHDQEHHIMDEIRASIRGRKTSEADPLETLFAARRMSPHPACSDISPISSETSSNGAFWGIGGTGFQFVHVKSSFREVPQWSQPLWTSQERWTHQLVVSEIMGSIAVLIQISFEQGLLSGAEFGPSSSLCSSAKREGVLADLAAQLDSVGVILREIDQSDEGGRFFKEVATYRLVWVDPEVLGKNEALSLVLRDSYYLWVSPTQLNKLCATSMATTNELRTLASLIIS
ncbi:NDP-hexose 2,3-dehydratase family protein [Pontimonas sp.]|nr:NDP-hexose 2,3-dehydratase family protein [Pontimonas sp.]MDA9116845.1 NDP-hexose 2,3-dehydratase family protein [Pontimonas sp.]